MRDLTNRNRMLRADALRSVIRRAQDDHKITTLSIAAATGIKPGLLYKMLEDNNDAKLAASDILAMPPPIRDACLRAMASEVGLVLSRRPPVAVGATAADAMRATSTSVREGADFHTALVDGAADGEWSDADDARAARELAEKEKADQDALEAQRAYARSRMAIK